jgi:hypothetical protein
MRTDNTLVYEEVEGRSWLKGAVKEGFTLVRILERGWGHTITVTTAGFLVRMAFLFSFEIPSQHSYGLPIV